MNEIPAPESVFLPPYNYRISIDEARINAASVENQNNLAGRIDPMALEIVIDPRIAPDRRKEVLIHECLHAMQMIVGTDQRKSITPHEAIYGLSHQILNWLRANPDVVAWLMDDWWGGWQPPMPPECSCPDCQARAEGSKPEEQRENH